MTLIPFNGDTPQVAHDAFVAHGSVLIGRVEIGSQSSVWYNCALRGDVNRIVVGKRSNIQDGSVIHADAEIAGGHPTLIGDDVLIGHMVMLHGSTLHDRAFVGLGAIVMEGCTIESDGMLGAGSLLPAGKVIRAGELWLGRPARKLRDLTTLEIAANQLGVAHYVENARAHKAAVSG